MRVVQAEEPQYEDDGSLHARLRHLATVMMMMMAIRSFFFLATPVTTHWLRAGSQGQDSRQFFVGFPCHYPLTLGGVTGTGLSPIFPDFSHHAKRD